jgi:hypothetical protein
MNNPQYKDPIVTKLIELFEANAHKDLRGKYYYGTPFIIAQNQLNFPAVCISGGVDSNTGKLTNTEDQSRILYRITVMIDVKKEWLIGKNLVGPEMEIHRILIGRDENMDMLPGSLEYVCRKFNVLDGENRLYIDLGRETRAIIRPNIEGRGRGMYLYEGVMEIEIKHNQIRPSVQQA